MDAERLVARAVVRRRADGLGDDERPPLRPPERDLVPAERSAERHRLEGDSGELPRAGEERHPEARRDRSTVTPVLAEELQDAARLAERTHPLVEFREVG